MQLIYTYKIEQKGVSAKPKTLNPNDLGRYSAKRCVDCLADGMAGSWELRPMLAEVGDIGLEPRQSQCVKATPEGRDAGGKAQLESKKIGRRY